MKTILIELTILWVDWAWVGYSSVSYDGSWGCSYLGTGMDWNIPGSCLLCPPSWLGWLEGWDWPKLWDGTMDSPCRPRTSLLHKAYPCDLFMWSFQQCDQMFHMVSQGPPKTQKERPSGILKAETKTGMVSFLLHSVGYSVSAPQPRLWERDNTRTWKLGANTVMWKYLWFILVKDWQVLLIPLWFVT